MAQTSSRSADSPGSPTLRERSTRNSTLVGSGVVTEARRRARNASAVWSGDSLATAARVSISLAAPDGELLAASRPESRGDQDTSQAARVVAWPLTSPVAPDVRTPAMSTSAGPRTRSVTSAGGGRRSVAAGNRIRIWPLPAVGITANRVRTVNGARPLPAARSSRSRIVASASNGSAAGVTLRAALSAR